MRNCFESDNTAADAPNPNQCLEEPTGGAFANWISDWRAFAIRQRRLDPEAPFLFVIDGLDEAEPPRSGDTVDPEDRFSPIDLLPIEEELPEHVYLLLTSRLPSGDDDVPGFLPQVIEPKYSNTH